MLSLTKLNKEFKAKFGQDLTQEQAWGIVALYAEFLGNEEVKKLALDKIKK